LPSEPLQIFDPRRNFQTQGFTGKGVTETVRAGLKKLASIRAQRELVRYRGKLDLGISVEDMKQDR
jgi:hypothetical protein